jgi:hypothetical protein
MSFDWPILAHSGVLYIDYSYVFHLWIQSSQLRIASLMVTQLARMQGDWLILCASWQELLIVPGWRHEWLGWEIHECVLGVLDGLLLHHNWALVSLKFTYSVDGVKLGWVVEVIQRRRGRSFKIGYIFDWVLSLHAPQLRWLVLGGVEDFVLFQVQVGTSLRRPLVFVLQYRAKLLIVDLLDLELWLDSVLMHRLVLFC